MSIVDKVKDIFDGRPEVHHDDDGYWVDVSGTKYHGASLEDLEGDLRNALAEQQANLQPAEFQVARIDTEMIATTDMAQPALNRIGDLEAALTAVEDERGRELAEASPE
ncbi:MAG: hypothetical protein WEB00_06625 [Dehalococcoidia bacterium]